MIPPSRLVLSQGWRLIDLPLRASNEGLRRPRVARAQKISRLHPLLCSGSKGSARVSFHPFFHRARSASKKGTWPLPALLADFLIILLVIAAPNARASAEAQSPAPRLRLCSHGTTRVVKSGSCAGYPGGGSTDSSAEGPRSVESPESVTGGGDPDVWRDQRSGLRSGVGRRAGTAIYPCGS